MVTLWRALKGLEKLQGFKGLYKFCKNFAKLLGDFMKPWDLEASHSLEGFTPYTHMHMHISFFSADIGILYEIHGLYESLLAIGFSKPPRALQSPMAEMSKYLKKILFAHILYLRGSIHSNFFCWKLYVMVTSSQETHFFQHLLNFLKGVQFSKKSLAEKGHEMSISWQKLTISTFLLLWKGSID